MIVEVYHNVLRFLSHIWPRSGWIIKCDNAVDLADALTNESYKRPIFGSQSHTDFVCNCNVDIIIHASGIEYDKTCVISGKYILHTIRSQLQCTVEDAGLYRTDILCRAYATTHNAGAMVVIDIRKRPCNSIYLLKLNVVYSKQPKSVAELSALMFPISHHTGPVIYLKNGQSTFSTEDASIMECDSKEGIQPRPTRAPGTPIFAGYLDIVFAKKTYLSIKFTGNSPCLISILACFSTPNARVTAWDCLTREAHIVLPAETGLIDEIYKTIDLLTQENPHCGIHAKNGDVLDIVDIHINDMRTMVTVAFSNILTRVQRIQPDVTVADLPDLIEGIRNGHAT